jgi:ATP-dependent Lon protease
LVEEPLPKLTASDEYEAPALLARDEVVFPHSDVVITTKDLRNSTALLKAAKERQLVVVIPGYSSKGVTGSIGTLALVRKTISAQGGVNASVKGLWRVHIEKLLEENEYSRVRFTRTEETEDAATGRSKTMQTVFDQLDQFIKLIPGIPIEIIESLMSAETPGKLADLCAYSPSFSAEERIDLLNTLGAEERLQKVSEHFEAQLTALREIAKAKTIPECETCMELADRVFESTPNRRAELASEFLNHVAQKHPGEVLALLAEKYGPTFMRRWALK